MFFSFYFYKIVQVPPKLKKIYENIYHLPVVKTELFKKSDIVVLKLLSSHLALSD